MNSHLLNVWYFSR